MKFFKFLILSLFLISSFLFANQSFAYDGGLSLTAKNLRNFNNLNYSTNPEQKFIILIGKVGGAALAFLAFLFVALLMYGGYTWMMARGNDEEAKKALAIIIAAIVGLLIILAAFILSDFAKNLLLKEGGGAATKSGQNSNFQTDPGTICNEPGGCREIPDRL